MRLEGRGRRSQVEGEEGERSGGGGGCHDQEELQIRDFIAGE